MAIESYKPTTPGRRGMTTRDFSKVTTRKPLRSLLKIHKVSSGRNNQGRITVRHRSSGGVKRFYRIVNFKLAPNTTATVEQIEYDPNRSSRIARIKDQTGTYHYIIAASNMEVGQTITSAADAPIENG